MGAPLSGEIDRPHGAEIFQVFQTLAGRSLAQVQPIDQRVHRKRLMRNEKKAVNFTIRPGLPKSPGKLDKKADRLDFDLFQV
jgi:hypothetical protein